MSCSRDSDSITNKSSESASEENLVQLTPIPTSSSSSGNNRGNLSYKNEVPSNGKDKSTPSSITVQLDYQVPDSRVITLRGKDAKKFHNYVYSVLQTDPEEGQRRLQDMIMNIYPAQEILEENVQTPDPSSSCKSHAESEYSSCSNPCDVISVISYDGTRTIQLIRLTDDAMKLVQLGHHPSFPSLHTFDLKFEEAEGFFQELYAASQSRPQELRFYLEQLISNVIPITDIYVNLTAHPRHCPTNYIPSNTICAITKDKKVEYHVMPDEDGFRILRKCFETREQTFNICVFGPEAISLYKLLNILASTYTFETHEIIMELVRQIHPKYTLYDLYKFVYKEGTEADKIIKQNTIGPLPYPQIRPVGSTLEVNKLIYEKKKTVFRMIPPQFPKLEGIIEILVPYYTEDFYIPLSMRRKYTTVQEQSPERTIEILGFSDSQVAPSQSIVTNQSDESENQNRNLQEVNLQSTQNTDPQTSTNQTVNSTNQSEASTVSSTNIRDDPLENRTLSKRASTDRIVKPRILSNTVKLLSCPIEMNYWYDQNIDHTTHDNLQTGMQNPIQQVSSNSTDEASQNQLKPDSFSSEGETIQDNKQEIVTNSDTLIFKTPGPSASKKIKKTSEFSPEKFYGYRVIFGTTNRDDVDSKEITHPNTTKIIWPNLGSNATDDLPYPIGTCLYGKDANDFKKQVLFMLQSSPEQYKKTFKKMIEFLYFYHADQYINALYEKNPSKYIQNPPVLPTNTESFNPVPSDTEESLRSNPVPSTSRINVNPILSTSRDPSKSNPQIIVSYVSLITKDMISAYSSNCKNRDRYREIGTVPSTSTDKPKSLTPSSPSKNKEEANPISSTSSSMDANSSVPSSATEKACVCGRCRQINCQHQGTRGRLQNVVAQIRLSKYINSILESNPKEGPRHLRKLVRSYLGGRHPISVMNMMSLEHYTFDPDTPKYDINQCNICTRIFVRNQIIRVLYCQHQFHADCIDKWLEQNNTCPYCKEVVFHISEKK